MWIPNQMNNGEKCFVPNEKLLNKSISTKMGNLARWYKVGR